MYLFLTALSLVLATVFPRSWVGLTDNQGHTVTVSAGAVSVTFVTPTPTPTPVSTVAAKTPSPTPANTPAPTATGPTPTATATPSTIFEVALTSGFGFDVTVAAPATSGGTDIVLGFIGFHYPGADESHTLPAGWTVVTDSIVNTGGSSAMEDVLISKNSPSGSAHATVSTGNVDVLLIDYAKGGGGTPVVDTVTATNCGGCNPLPSGAITSAGASEKYVLDYESHDANGSNLSYSPGVPALNQLFFSPGTNYHFTLDANVNAGPATVYSFYNDGGPAGAVAISVLLK